MKIYFAENNERAEAESIEKGCRLDVLVEIDGNYYKPLINTIGRLAQEVNDAFVNDEIFDSEPCQILVNEASKETIIKTILELNNQKFFSSFMPVDLKKLYSNNFVELTDISNWTQIYK